MNNIRIYRTYVWKQDPGIDPVCGYSPPYKVPIDKIQIKLGRKWRDLPVFDASKRKYIDE